MKKYIMMLLLALGPVWMNPAAARKVNKNRLGAFVQEYKGKDNIEVINLGSVALRLMRGAAKLSADSREDREALKVMDGLNRVMIVHYDEADARTRQRFVSGLDKILRDSEKLVEAKSDGEVVHIFGTLSGDGEKVEDVVIHVPDSGTLVCLFGSLAASQLENVMPKTR
ncbi:MAG: DUF4252 domain-containing protein [Bacteroidales bacterium]|nr:DUF4252 domain-containing protein [Bacteroidales bacterium]